MEISLDLQQRTDVEKEKRRFPLRRINRTDFYTRLFYASSSSTDSLQSDMPKIGGKEEEKSNQNYLNVEYN